MFGNLKPHLKQQVKEEIILEILKMLKQEEMKKYMKIWGNTTKVVLRRIFVSLSSDIVREVRWNFCELSRWFL